MNTYSQYGEEDIINSFFNNKKNGVLVDLGAADGVLYSNSRYLIDVLGWFGTLVEPHPEFFKQLTTLYQNNSNIILLNKVVYNEEKLIPFFVYGREYTAQVSTLSEKFKQKVTIVHGDKYEPIPIMVESISLNNILSTYKNVDFLSIDCEGVDMEVLQSNNWNLYRPSLICVEHSMPEDELRKFMSENNYSFLTKTTGNSFFVAK